VTTPTRSYRQRLRAKTAHIRSILDAIDQRAAAAEASTTAPPRRPNHRVDTSGYADPTALTAESRDQLLGVVERDLWAAQEHLHQTAARLASWAPNHNPDNLCTCPHQCCPQGCTRDQIDGRNEHPTCRSRRFRARARGEQWALEGDHAT
jgi:hypothetical protein